MAVNEAEYRKYLHQGYSHRAALALADPATDTTPTGAAVATPAPMTAPATMAVTYTQSEVNALRADVAALRTTVSNLLTSLRDAGLLNP